MREHRKAAVSFGAGFRHDAFRHLALKHQHQAIVAGRPRLNFQPADQKDGRDIVGQVGDDANIGIPQMLGGIEFQRVAFNDRKTSRMVSRNLLQGRDGAPIALDRDHPRRPFRQQRARQTAGTGSDFNDGDASAARGACDAPGQIEIEKEILAERLLRGETVLADDLTQRRQIVGSRSLRGWSGRSLPCGELCCKPQRRNQTCGIGAAGARDIEGRAVIGRGANEGQAERGIHCFVKGDGLDRDQRLIVIHAKGHIIGLPGSRVKQRVRRERPSNRDARARSAPPPGE